MKTWHTIGWLVLLFAAAVCASAQATAPTSGPAPQSPPPYTVLRYDEDYSYLRDPAMRSDPFDAIKYVPLNQQGDWYASIRWAGA